MERKDFIKSGAGFLGLGSLIFACSKSVDSSSGTTTTSGSDSTSTSTTTSGSCTATSDETAGPYPTKSPASYVRSDITDGQTGVALTIKITIRNVNNSCAVLSGALVDIWHCTALGYYSEYSDTPGGSYATIDYTSSHFLRGRQTTDSNGLVTFTSIFPGWYSPRAPHIHVHVYNSAGTSLKITQIAFPTDICDTVYTTVSPYSQRGKQDTANTADMVFSDSLSNELATVTGSVSAGYVLTHTIYVAA